MRWKQPHAFPFFSILASIWVHHPLIIARNKNKRVWPHLRNLSTEANTICDLSNRPFSIPFIKAFQLKNKVFIYFLIILQRLITNWILSKGRGDSFFFFGYKLPWEKEEKKNKSKYKHWIQSLWVKVRNRVKINIIIWIRIVWLLSHATHLLSCIHLARHSCPAKKREREWKKERTFFFHLAWTCWWLVWPSILTVGCETAVPQALFDWNTFQHPCSLFLSHREGGVKFSHFKGIELRHIENVLFALQVRVKKRGFTRKVT